jgi:hypothetical protein
MEEESMSDPGFAPPNLCSIHTAAEQEEPAEAVRGGFSAGGCPLGDDDPPAPLTSGIDRAIRLSTAVAVLAVAGIAAYVSYWHAYAVVWALGKAGITGRLELACPACGHQPARNASVPAPRGSRDRLAPPRQPIRADQPVPALRELPAPHRMRHR